jgi:hypothetical protein
MEPVTGNGPAGDPRTKRPRVADTTRGFSVLCDYPFNPVVQFVIGRIVRGLPE